MKILLTGASGFVGSHILESLRARGVPTVVLLRSKSNRQFIEPLPPDVEVRTGSISEVASLRQAMAGVTHVIHCAGATKALTSRDFYAVNQGGTRNVIEAANAQSGRVQRFLHISSLAAAGPATPDNPARESDLPKPVSTYGKSKLAGEQEVRTRCRSEHVILRPAAVYGPRDAEFLRIFKAVKRHLLPGAGSRQAFSLVFVKDLAEAAVTCLTHTAAAGKTFFVAARQPATASLMAREIAKQMSVWTLPLPLPSALLWPICLAQEGLTRLMGKANVLSLQKFAELRAPGWVCDPGLLERETGFACTTALADGVAQTLAWYREQHWL